MILILNNSIFARNVRYMRTRKGMSIGQLAREADMERDTLTGIEEERLLEFDALASLRLCHALGTDIQTMVERELAPVNSYAF